ncbi:MAG: site-specific tyrosine recombinase XerD [Clostridiaceae bacterium]|jgi:integrase/recombinase XerD|nr:MAG: site-specific tyrosine recombinase XerD [Clostridiaceae bacterium]
MNENLENYRNYLKYERAYSDNTVGAYMNDLNKYEEFLKKDILESDTEDLEKYLKYIKNLESTTVAHKITSIKSYFNYNIKRGIVSVNPADKVSRPKLTKHLPEYLTEEEVGKLLDVEVKSPYDYRNKTILELLYSSGIRISELVNIKTPNYDSEECLIRIMGKGSKERIVPLGDYAVNIMNDYMNNYRPLINKKHTDYVFINNRGDKISRQFIFKVIKKEALKKGIKKDISPHTLRHTFATHLLKNGADLRIIQELLGHENISTTQIYTHVTNNKLKSDYETYFPKD